MKVTNTNYKNLGKLHKNLNLSNLDSTNTLIQIFSGLDSEFDIKQIQSIFQEKNSDISFIGTTTTGEIYDGKVDDGGIVISIMEFENTTLVYDHSSGDNDYDMGVNIANKLFKDNTKAMILFVDGLLTNGSDVLDGISSIDSTTPIAGGLAGDNGAFKETFVFEKMAYIIKVLLLYHLIVKL